MKLIIALGNPGPEYISTRHNFGWRVFDVLSLKWQEKVKFYGLISEKMIDGEKILFLKPRTFYNDSGKSVRAVIDFYKIPCENVLIIHDELALPFGSVRTRIGGSDAGNNGIKSINTHIGSDTARIRLGIANELREKMNDADFVLASFSLSEREKLSEIIATSKKYIDAFISDNFDSTTHSH